MSNLNLSTLVCLNFHCHQCEVTMHSELLFNLIISGYLKQKEHASKY